MTAPLDRVNRWVTAPSVITSFAGFALALAYALTTLDFPEGTGLSLAVIGAAVAVLASVLGDRAEQARLGAVRAIASSAAARTPEQLGRAALELAAFPEHAFWVSLGYWCAGAVVIGVGWLGWAEVPLPPALRAIFVGVMCGPVVALLTHLLVLGRTRQALAALVGAGLPLPELHRLLPAARQQLSQRLFLFVAIAVVSPLVFVVDLSLQAFDDVLAAATRSSDVGSALLAFEVVAGRNLLGLGAVVVLVLAMAVASAWLGGSALGGPVGALAEQTRAFAEGHLERTRVVPAEDEVWAAGVAFAGMAAQLDETVRRLGGTGLKLGTTVEELAASGQKHLAGAQEQRGALAHTSTTTEELARSARQVSTNATHVSDLAQKTVGSAQAGKKSADAFYASIVQVREGNQAVADSVVKLNKRVQQVGRIVEFIDGIADRSDLLALNAELEGTKAGEVGRGFSLVAAEMRRLSESVMSSTQQISRLIDEIRDATNAAVMATEAGVKATDVGKTLAQKVSASFDSILQYANLTSDAVKSISLATSQQQAGTDQLAQAMGEILKSTEEGTGASRQMAEANDDLGVLARELKSAVERVGGR